MVDAVAGGTAGHDACRGGRQAALDKQLDNVLIDVAISVDAEIRSIREESDDAVRQGMCIYKDSVPFRTTACASEFGTMAYSNQGGCHLQEAGPGIHAERLDGLDSDKFRRALLAALAGTRTGSIRTLARASAASPASPFAPCPDRRAEPAGCRGNDQVGRAGRPGRFPRFILQRSQRRLVAPLSPRMHPFVADGRRQESISLFIAPAAMRLGNSVDGQLSGTVEASHRCKVKFERKV